MKIAIVGAGAAGLAAAHFLRDSGNTITLFEARDRIGGNLLTIRTERGYYEAGGEWIDREHTHTIALLRAHGLEPEPADPRPMRLIYQGETRDDDHIWSEASEDLYMVHAEATRLAQMMPADPLNHPIWAEQDQRTLADFLQEHTTSPAGQWLAKAKFRSDEGHEPDRIGLLGWLKSYANYLGREAEQEEMSAFRFPGGAINLLERIASTLPAPIRFGHLLTRISYTEDSATLVFENGHTETADRVILTLPPPCVRRLDLSPTPPLARQAAWAAINRAPVTKVVLRFRTPFWDAPDWNGALLTDLPMQQIWAGGREGEYALVAYICGEEALHLQKNPDQAVPRTLRQLTETHLGSENEFLDGTFYPWNDDLSGGGGFSYTPVGYMSVAYPVLARPLGAIHFAGEAYGDWFGFIEGAIETAERAVAHILDSKTPSA